MKPSRRPKGSAAEAGAVAVRVVRDLAPAAVLTDLAAGVAVRAVQDSARVVVLTTLWVRGGGAGKGQTVLRDPVFREDLALAARRPRRRPISIPSRAPTIRTSRCSRSSCWRRPCGRAIWAT